MTLSEFQPPSESKVHESQAMQLPMDSGCQSWPPDAIWMAPDVVRTALDGSRWLFIGPGLPTRMHFDPFTHSPNSFLLSPT